MWMYLLMEDTLAVCMDQQILFRIVSSTKD